MSAFSLYVFGFFVLLGGLGYGAYLLHVPSTWIIVGALVAVGLGVMSAVSHTKSKDPPSDDRSAHKKGGPKAAFLLTRRSDQKLSQTPFL